MAKFVEVKKALKEELLQAQPLMDVHLVKKEFLDWLAELHFPVSPEVHSWDDCLKVTPPTDEDRASEEGHRVRFSLNLHTKENHYLILIIENLASDSREVYAISVHVKWRKDEWQMQRLADTNYKGQFTDIPKSRHTLWAQNFRIGDLGDALNACAVAILGHELAPHGTESTTEATNTVRPPVSRPLDLPEKSVDARPVESIKDETSADES